MWNELVLAYEGPSDTRHTKIVALRLKFNAFKALEAEVNATFVNSLPSKWLSMNQTKRAKNSIKNDCLAALYGKYHYEEGLIDDIYDDLDVEEDNRTSNEFMVDLNAEYQERVLLANQKRFYKRLGRDDESVSSEDEDTTKLKAFMAIVEDDSSMGKADASSGQ
ncbi:hypothetical protein Tco_0389502 [Tanacetum coccineum]